MLVRPYDVEEKIHPRGSHDILASLRVGMANGVINDIHGAAAGRVFFPLTATEMEVVALAGGEQNTGAGTGVQTVRCFMLGPGYEYLEQVVTMNGITPVPIPGGPYLRGNYVQAETVGSTGTTEGGDIVIRATSGGEEIRRIVVGRNESQDGAYTTPAGSRTIIIAVGWALFNQKVNDVAGGFVQTRSSPTAPWFRLVDSITTLTEAIPAITIPFDNFETLLAPGHDLRISGLAAAINIDMGARLVLRYL